MTTPGITCAAARLQAEMQECRIAVRAAVVLSHTLETPAASAAASVAAGRLIFAHLRAVKAWRKLGSPPAAFRPAPPRPRKNLENEYPPVKRRRGGQPGNSNACKTGAHTAQMRLLRAVCPPAHSSARCGGSGFTSPSPPSGERAG
jgi:hypothetical protein